jgi:type IV secretion system protein TrbB
MENPFDTHAQDPTGNALRRLLPVLGASISALLAEAAVSDVYLNPDGSVWIETPREGRQHTSLRLLPTEASQVVHGMARLAGTLVHSGAPILSVELIALQARFLGVVPPLVRAASFSIHKFTKPSRSLSDYVTDGTLTDAQRMALEQAIIARHTVLISGGPRTGKTTFASALLSVMSQLPDRVLVLERAARLRSNVSHHISLRAAAPDISLQSLLRIGVKWRPDRIVVDEIEGPELPELLRAWQGVHAGGFTATSAGSPRGALVRLEEILLQAGEVAPRACVARAVQVVVHLSGRGNARRVAVVMALAGADWRGYSLTPMSPESP